MNNEINATDETKPCFYTITLYLKKSKNMDQTHDFGVERYFEGKKLRYRVWQSWVGQYTQLEWLRDG